MARLATRLAGYWVAAAVIGTSVSACAQVPPVAVPVVLPAAVPAAQVAGLRSPAELEQLVASIALYPDELLGQVLIASTYPLEVVHAARWVRDAGSAAYSASTLDTLLAGFDWDPSVKSLVPFPQVLQMMDSHLVWTQTLGDAFLAQQWDVMQAVQRLRHRALADGTLRSTDQQMVIIDGATIKIVPARPQVVYVPYYDPTIVYGPWPYAEYPPYWFPPPPSYYVEPSVVPGIYFFAGGVVVVSWLWDWVWYDWHRHYFHIDHNRYNRIHRGHRPVQSDKWAHDHYHRRSVPYPTEQTRKEYGDGHPHGHDGSPEHRGYGPGEPPEPAVIGGHPGGPPPAETVAPPPKEKKKEQPPTRFPGAREPRPEWQGRTPPVDRPRAVTPPPAPPTTVRTPAPDVRINAPRPRVERPERPARPVVRQAAPPAERPRIVPPAFRQIDNGAQVRREAERGRESRQAARPVIERPARVSPPAQAKPERAQGSDNNRTRSTGDDRRPERQRR